MSNVEGCRRVTRDIFCCYWLTSLQVDPDTVASDSFMINVQAVLLRFAEPFMDSKYSKVNLKNICDVETNY